MTFKLDIFSLLSKIDSKCPGNIYSQLTEDEKKGFSALVTLRWMSGTSDANQILKLNRYVNNAVFPLGKHPEILMKLLQAASSKINKRYSWYSVKSKSKKPMTLKVLQDYFEMSEREVKLLNPLPPPEEILQMAEAVGLWKEEIAKLKKELT